MSAIKLDTAHRNISSRSLLSPLDSVDSSASSDGTTSDGQPSASGTLTNLPSQDSEDLASQALVDSLNILTLGASGPLVRDIRQLRSRLNQLLRGQAKSNSKTVNGFQSDPTESLFTEAVSKDDAPLEGAVYKQGQTIYANRPESKVKAIYRVQVLLSLGTIAPLPLFPVSFPLGNFDIMIPVGFLYRLDKDEDGFIYQMPFVPKIEAGVELDIAEGAGEAAAGPVGGVLGLLSPFKPMVEVKGETTIEQTFIWIRFADKMAFRALAVLMKLFNLFPDLPFRIGLQSCEGNEGDDLPIPFQGESQPSTPSTVPVSPPG